jgi:thiol-disulfide isomerase/thioredoxin
VNHAVRLFFAVLALAAVSAAAATQVGDAPPSCRIEGFDGAPAFDVAARPGKVVYVDFWASWCGPCAESFPFLDQLQRELGPQGLEVVGVGVDEDPAEARAFLRRRSVSFAVGHDPDGSCARAYDVKAMPSSYLVDRRGVVRHVYLGFRAADRAAIREQLVPLLAGER